MSANARISYELSVAVTGPAKREAVIGPGSLRRAALRMAKENDFSQSETALKLRISTRTLQEWERVELGRDICAALRSKP